MAKITIFIGGLLIGLGLVGYFTSETKSVTALIPAFFGGGLCLFGAVSLNESWRAHGMHSAVGVSFLGALAGLGRGIPVLIGYLSGEPDVNTKAMTFVLVMTAICIIHVVLCVFSFIQARKNATASGKAG